uniref:Uncharacterized protein n=1 Tax=Nelumbo nucifera TaxID=4432 RepID=A0A822XMP2_NELNU|nr:TPA_asm: hypothetical protein HUJ06_021934 [Nelumbo nucifera]
MLKYSSLVPGKPKASQPLQMKKPYTRKLLDRDPPTPTSLRFFPRLLPSPATNPYHCLGSDS